MANESNKLLSLPPWLVELRKMVSKVAFTFRLNYDIAHLICGWVYRKDGFKLEDAYRRHGFIHIIAVILYSYIRLFCC